MIKGLRLNLDRIGAMPEDDQELRKTVWLARAHAALVRCEGVQRTAGLASLQALDATLRIALPEGGAVARRIRAMRAECQARSAR